MALQGDMGTVPLRDVLGWLARRRSSGTLSLSRGMVVRQFHLSRGRVMLSSSTDQEMLLGRLLIERGIVDRAQLQAALDTRQGSHVRLGAVLARAGMVSAADLRGVLTEKIRRLLLDALTWTDGDFFFNPGAFPKRSAVAAIVDLAEVLALPAKVHLESVDPNDVVITDDDIIEIMELAKPRRAAGAGPRTSTKKTAATRAGASRRPAAVDCL